MKRQHSSAQQARVYFPISLTSRIAFASALTAALVSASSLVPARKTLAADDVERSVAMMAKIGSASSPSFSPDGSRVA